MVSALIGLAMAQLESPRLITRLENGATLLVERMPSAKSVSVHLWVGPRGVRETVSTHGHRHLLEHLVTKGLDGPLESQGVLLLARTYRDAMQFELTGPPANLETILGAVDKIVAGREYTLDELEAEVKIMRHELALEGAASVLNRATWRGAFGDDGLDPLGDLEAMAKATPDVLAALHRRLFAPSNVVLVIVGPVEVVPTTKRAKERMEEWQGEPTPLMARKPGKPERVESDAALGEVRGALIENFSDVGATLAAAYAIAARNESAYVVYTPSVGAGLVLLGRTGRNNALGQAIDAMTEGEEAFLLPIGRAMARNFVDRLLETPSGAGYLRGFLLVLGLPSPDELRRAAVTVDWPSFRAAVARFRRERAAVAVGVGR